MLNFKTSIEFEEFYRVCMAKFVLKSIIEKGSTAGWPGVDIII